MQCPEEMEQGPKVKGREQVGAVADVKRRLTAAGEKVWEDAEADKTDDRVTIRAEPLKNRRRRHMIEVLLVSSDHQFFSNLTPDILDADGLHISRADSANEAIVMISDNHYDLVVADDFFSDMSGLEFIQKVVKTHPMVNCAVVSRLLPKAFHEASEGLGILMQLPPNPDIRHAKELLQCLKNILQRMPKSLSSSV